MKAHLTQAARILKIIAAIFLLRKTNDALKISSFHKIAIKIAKLGSSSNRRNSRGIEIMIQL